MPVSMLVSINIFDVWNELEEHPVFPDVSLNRYGAPCRPEVTSVAVFAVTVSWLVESAVTEDIDTFVGGDVSMMKLGVVALNMTQLEHSLSSSHAFICHL